MKHISSILARIARSLGFRRRRGISPTGECPEPDTSMEELRTALAEAEAAKDAEQIERIRDRIRVFEYWKQKGTRQPSTDRRVKKKPTLSSEWKTDEKRFNNFR